MAFWDKKKNKASKHRPGDPAKEVDLMILELEDNRKTAMKELLSFKAGTIKMESDLADMLKQSETWEKRAMLALKKNDEELAKKCLAKKKEVDVSAEGIQRDMKESARYAYDLNESRKVFERKLRDLKLKKGTLVAQIQKARGNDVFDFSKLDDILDGAEEKIEDSIALSEVNFELAVEDDS